jgi:hypothetical protein
MKASPSTAVFDRSKALSGIGGDSSFLRELCESFLHNSKNYVDAICTSAAQKDGPALVTASNALRSAASGFHAQRVCAVAGTLSAIGTAGDFDNAQQALKNLDKEVNALCEELRAEVAGNAATGGADLSKKKTGILDLVEELRITVETSYAIKDALQIRMNELQDKLSQKESDIDQLRREFEALKEKMLSEDLTKSPSAIFRQMIKDMSEKISAIQAQSNQEQEYMAALRTDMAGMNKVLNNYSARFKTFTMRFAQNLGKDIISDQATDKPVPKIVVKPEAKADQEVITKFGMEKFK